MPGCCLSTAVSSALICLFTYRGPLQRSGPCKEVLDRFTVKTCTELESVHPCREARSGSMLEEQPEMFRTGLELEFARRSSPAASPQGRSWGRGGGGEDNQKWWQHQAAKHHGPICGWGQQCWTMPDDAEHPLRLGSGEKGGGTGSGAIRYLCQYLAAKASWSYPWTQTAMSDVAEHPLQRS